MKYKSFPKSNLIKRSLIALLMVIFHHANAQPVVAVWGNVDNPRHIEVTLKLILEFLDVTEKIFVSVHMSEMCQVIYMD